MAERKEGEGGYNKAYTLRLNKQKITLVFGVCVWWVSGLVQGIFHKGAEGQQEQHTILRPGYESKMCLIKTPPPFEKDEALSACSITSLFLNMGT